jgi:hypothetical protein
LFWIVKPFAEWRVRMGLFPFNEHDTLFPWRPIPQKFLQRLPEETALLNERNKLSQFCSRDHLVWIVKDDERPLRKDHVRISFVKCDFVAGNKECDAKSIDEPKSLREEE